MRKCGRGRWASFVAVLAAATVAVGLVGVPGKAEASSAVVPQAAVTASVAAAARSGVTQYAAVMDRSTGKIVGSSGGDTPVAAASVVKLFTAAYYLHQSSAYAAQISYMIRVSDDATETRLWDCGIVAWARSTYGLSSQTANSAWSCSGWWGTVRITPNDMVRFLAAASRDAAVWPTLSAAMLAAADYGSDGFNQNFGMNALSGAGSKQGWTDKVISPSNTSRLGVHSVGFTSRYWVAILQTGTNYSTMRSAATNAANAINASVVAVTVAKPARLLPITNGSFVAYQGAVYVIAGGAPLWVTNWANVGGQKPIRTLTAAQWSTLRTYPADGTLLREQGGTVFIVAGGAPVYVSNWANIGGYRPATLVDEVTLAAAGAAGPGGRFGHLRAFPADGTYLVDKVGTAWVVAGGAPIPISSWAHMGGQQRVQLIDGVSIANAGRGGVWNHLRARPADNTYVRDLSGRVYTIGGGAPLYVSNWARVGGVRPTVLVDSTAIANSGKPGVWVHLSRYPADGTYLRGSAAPTVYRVSGGKPIVAAASAAELPARTVVVLIDQVNLTGPSDHLLLK